jgi:hypothetical protein
MNVISPREMMDVLHAPYPETTRAHLRRASLDMLRNLYKENPDHPKVREAQLAMETAISEWSDEQVVDFLLNHFFEPPYSTEFQSKSPSELRQILVDIHNYLFLDLSQPG